MTSYDHSQPKDMDGYIARALECLDNMEKIPKFYYKRCAGVVLISGSEFGIGVSKQDGAGVVMGHTDGKWSPPVAVNLSGVGFGAVLGYTPEKQYIIFLNHLSMHKLIEQDVSLKLGGEIGIAFGTLGGTIGGEVAVGGHGGIGSTTIFTFSKGAIISAQVESAMVSSVPGLLASYYHESNAKAVLDNKVSLPEETTVAPLLEKLNSYVQASDEE